MLIIYICQGFQQLCDSEGLIHEITPPYTPLYNGTTRRKNKTNMNMVRCMLKSKNLPNYLWHEAVSTTVHILNRSPTKRLTGMTLEVAWTGVKPCVAHLRVFGSICYKHIPD